MTANLRFFWVIFWAAILLLLLVPLQLVGLILARFGWTGLASGLPVLFHRLLLFLFGIRVRLNGKLVKDRPLLLVANHVSWLDIVVFGSVAPLCFIAKAEMSSWPLFGSLAKLQRTVFVRREERRNSQQQANEIAERLTKREVMVLFPEGTTTDGNQIAPFKTPLFEAAKIALRDSPVETAAVQPAAIDYSHLHGLPIGRAERPHVAWPGELGLGESFIPVVKMGALDVIVHLDDPIALDEHSNRKIIARQALNSIRTMLDSSRRGE